MMVFQGSVDIQALRAKAKRLTNADSEFWGGVHATLEWLDGVGQHPDHYAPEEEPTPSIGTMVSVPLSRVIDFRLGRKRAEEEAHNESADRRVLPQDYVHASMPVPETSQGGPVDGCH